MIPKGKVILSPAHGKVIRILQTRKLVKLRKGILGIVDILTNDIASECWVICIRLHVHNIHVQRAPISGVITEVKYTKGSFHNAVRNAAQLKWLENEKNEISIKSSEFGFSVKVVQIAGALAKTIKGYVQKNEKVIKGQLIGHIALGSQVTLIIPKRKNIELTVHENDRVIDGESILARIK